MTSEKQTVGILGLGFLGKLLAGIQNWKDGSWGSWHSSPVDLTGLHQFRYNWQDPADWPLIPSGPVVLVLTIPPPRIELERIPGPWPVLGGEKKPGFWWFSSGAWRGRTFRDLKGFLLPHSRVDSPSIAPCLGQISPMGMLALLEHSKSPAIIVNL